MSIHTYTLCLWRSFIFYPLVEKPAMKMLQLVLLLGIVAFSHGQECLSDPNPVMACSAAEVLGYLREAQDQLSDCHSISILTDSGASCADLLRVLRISFGDLGSGECLPASVDPDSGNDRGAAATGDAEDDANTETIDDPQASPGVVVVEPTAPTEPLEDPECYTNEDGSDYFGDVSVTVSGRTCQLWSEKLPHRPIRKYRGYGENIMHPNHFGAHNHCRTLPFMAIRRTAEERNNYSGRTGPWCHTTDPDERWEYCDVGEPQDSC